MVADIQLKTWAPLVKDSILREKILITLENFSQRLLQCQNKANGALTGNAGISLFFAYLALFTENEKYRDKSIELIDVSLDSINSFGADYGLSLGPTGILWCFKHLIDIGIIDADIDKIVDAEIETTIMKRSVADLKLGIYDYLSCGIGTVPYLLERIKNKNISTQFPEIVAALLASAEKTENGISWLNKFAMFSGNPSADKEYNLGIAHGMPAIIIALSLLVKANVEVDTTSAILNQSIKWLLDLQGKDSDISLFSSHHPKQEEYSRLGWCYGDLSVANAVLMAAINTNNSVWLNAAIQIGLHAAKRTELSTARIIDTQFCHGSIGLAHMFNRFYHYTHKKEFKEAAIFWYEQTMKFAEKLGHFKMYRRLTAEDKDYDWHDFDSLIEGIAGIGLGLMAAISDIEPKWDKLFLLS